MFVLNLNPKIGSEVAYFTSMRAVKALFALVFLIGTSLVRADFADAQREVIMFRSGQWTFNGYLYKPEGNGPFPAVIWNHGHHEHLTKQPPAEYDELAKLYTRDGIVFLIPDRHVHDISRSDYSRGLQVLLESDPKGEAAKEKMAAEELEINTSDVLAACDWLKSQSYIDSKRVAVSGWSLGACVSLAAAEKSGAFCAVALFSPRTMDWNKSPALQERLLNATKKLSIPVFVVLASDEPASDSTDAIKKEIENTKTTHRIETYQHAGYRSQEKTCLAVNGIDTWGYDVLRFVQVAMKN